MQSAVTVRPTLLLRECLVGNAILVRYYNTLMVFDFLEVLISKRLIP